MNYYMRGIVIFFLVATGCIYGKHKYTYMGEDAFSHGNYDIAFSYFQKAIDAGETQGEPWFFMGSIKDAKREYAASIPYFERAVARPLKRDYKVAALWKIVLYYKNAGNAEKALEYAYLMQKNGINNSTVRNIIDSANASITPETLKSREYLKKAKEEDERLSATDGVDYQKYKPEVADIIRNYQSAIQLNSSYFPYYWRIAFLYEKLEDWESAYKIYLKIHQQGESYKTNYKLGIIEKRRNHYPQALEYLRDVINNVPKDQKQLRYYSHLNISQVYYGMGNIQSAKIHAHAAMELEGYRVNSEEKTRIATVTYCLSAVSQVLHSKEPLEIPPLCKQLTLPQKENLPPEEIIAIQFLEAKMAHHQMLKEQKAEVRKTHEKKASLLYQKSLFGENPDATQSTGLSVFLNEWLAWDLRFPINFFYRQKKYDMVLKIAQTYPGSEKVLKPDDMIQIHFRLDNHRKVMEIYQDSMGFPSFQKASLSAAKVGDFPYLEKIIRARINASPDKEFEKAKIETFLKNPEFDSYKTFLANQKSP